MIEKGKMSAWLEADIIDSVLPQKKIIVAYYEGGILKVDLNGYSLLCKKQNLLEGECRQTY